MYKVTTYLIIFLLVLSCNKSKKETTSENIMETENKSVNTPESLTLNTERLVESKDDGTIYSIEESTDEVNNVNIEIEKEVTKESSNLTPKTEDVVDNNSIAKTSNSSNTESNKEEVVEEVSNTTSKSEEVKNDSSGIETEEDTKSETIKEKPKVIIDESPRSFIKKKYQISGNWSLKQEGDKVYIVFHSNFKTKSGPDLKVFITKQSMSSVNGKNAENNSIFLKDLKSNKGEQRYLIPSHIDLSQYKSILIHCKKYAKLWGGGNL